MKKIITIVFLSFISTYIIAQTDDNGNPIFNNVQIENIEIDDYSISLNYYTIKNNIDNNKSSVYVSDSPELKDYIKFARDYPSYFAIISKNNEAKYMLILLQQNKDGKTSFIYNIVDAESKRSMEVPCQVWGEITEKRVDEIIENNYDSTAEKGAIVGTNKKQFSYNKMIYGYQPYKKVKEEIIAISKELMSPKLTSAKEVRKYIKKETINGELDFNKVLEKEENALFAFDGFAYNKKDFAIYLWGKKVQTLGIKSGKSAVKLWEEINERKLSKAEKGALKRGFESK